jgi:hypothetical protein
MDNKLPAIINFENLPLEKMDSDQLNQLSAVIQAKQIELVNKKLIHNEKRMFMQEQRIVELEKGNQELQNKFTDLDSEIRTQSEKLFQIHSKSADDKYVTMRNLGQFNEPPIANRMSKLLRYAGIIKESSYPSPYTSSLEGDVPLCISYKITNAKGFEKLDYKYNIKKCWMKIRKALEKNGQLLDFLGCKTKKELDSFIDKL